MARSRNIKPGFFRNEALAELPFEYRLLFAGLWCLADREGRLEDRPKRIRMELFPADNVDVEAGLMALELGKLITRYRVDSGNYVWINTFLEHQRPHYNEVKSTIPAYLGTPEQQPRLEALAAKVVVTRADCLIPDSLIPDSLITQPSVESARAKKSRKKPETPIPEGFLVSERVSAWAKAKGYEQLERHLDNFRLTCVAKGYVYADWDSAFMKAIDHDWARVRSGNGSQPRGQDAIAEAMRLTEERERRENPDAFH